MATKKPVPKTKGEILADIAESAGITKAQAGAAYDRLIEIVYAGAKHDTGLMIPGIGKIKKVKRAARKAINPFTKQMQKYPAKTVAKLTLCKACKECVK